MSSSTEIRANLNVVREQIASACARAGRPVADVTLVAVSKQKPVEAVLAALDAGIMHLGENRIEEASVKIPLVHAATQIRPAWHMIGHIQSRKTRDIVPYFQVVESVDRLKIAQKLSEAALESQNTVRVLLEINISGEDAKYGFAAQEWQTRASVLSTLLAEIEPVLALPGLNVCGLMTMAPYYAEMDATRPVFSSLYELREVLRKEFGLPFPDLSMGMTNDFPIAIEEGATIVRIGRAIFGDRN
jgi:hypothetical protein